MTDLKRMTFRQMSAVVQAMWWELKRRNPIGVNFYEAPFAQLHHDLREIHVAELSNPTCECGPGSGKRRLKR